MKKQASCLREAIHKSDAQTRKSNGLFDYAEIEAFSDGVFAIAITLLVLRSKFRM